MTGFKSYREQSAHYFNRPHDNSATAVIDSPAAWYGRDLRLTDDWIVSFTTADIKEVNNAISHASGLNKNLQELTAADFPLPTLSLRNIAPVFLARAR